MSRRVARLRADGLSAKRVRGRQYARPYHGLRPPADIQLEQPALRVADAIGLMVDGCVLTGWASRWIQGQAYSDGSLYGEDLPVTILCAPGTRLRNRPGIRVRERRLVPGEVIDLGGFEATTMARATYDDMLDAPNRLEALVAVEMATSTVIEQARTALDNVRATFAAHVKTRGRAQARWALGAASTRSASPWEPRTRMLATAALGIEDWCVNLPVFDRFAELIGIPDLRDPETGLVIESDGGDHRRIERHNDDNVRGDAFEKHGMPVVRIGAAQHARAERSETMRRMVDGRARAVAVAGPRRWTTDKPAWWWDWAPGRQWD